MRSIPRSPLLRSLLALGSVAAVAAVQYATWPLLSATPYQLFYLLLLFIAWNLGTIPGLVGVGASLVTVDFLFLEPVYELGLGAEAVAPSIVATLAMALTAHLGRSSRRARHEADRLLTIETSLRSQAERSAERNARLQAITSAFAEALTIADVATALTERGLPLLHATSGSLGLVRGAGDRIEFIGASGTLLRPALLEIEAPVPLADAARTRRPVFLDDGPSGINDGTDAGGAPTSAAGPSTQGGYAALPLIAHRSLIGVVDMTFAGHIGREDRQLIFALAHQCSQALDRAMLYEENVRLYEDALAANWAKDEFLATVSHEVRTPLNAILGWSQILREPVLDDQTARQAVDAIERSAQAQARLIDDILDVSRVAAGKLTLDRQPLELERVIRSAHDALLPEADAAGVALALNVEQNLPPVDGDYGRLEQVLSNLLANAIRHTPRGGHVELGVRAERSALVVTVTDNGSGIPPDLLPHLFERYRQGAGDEGPSGSLGLGLSIVKSIVQLHGGTVEAASDGPGCGACFTIRLPIARAQHKTDDAERAIEHSADPSAAAPLSGVRVLAVDDDDDSRVLVGTILRRAGAEVVVADTVGRAIELATTWRPRVIVSDIAMPGADGYDLLRSLSTSRSEPAPPVIAVTAFARPEDRQRALDAGFSAHLSKPVEPEALVAVVRRHADLGTTEGAAAG